MALEIAPLANAVDRLRGLPGGGRVSLYRIEQAAGVMARLSLLPKHRRLVRDILAEHLPPKARVWVFGSRATGRARRYSDLDLAIDAGRRLTLDEFGRLAEVFSGSDLPYRIDVVDWQAIDDRFRKVIADGRVPLAEDAPPDVATVADPATRAS